MKPANIAIFASGNGSNANKIIEHFKGNCNINVSAIFTNKGDAGVAELARQKQIPLIIFSRNDFRENDLVVKNLQQLRITHIVLAGFLWLIPPNLLAAYRDRIINIHPSLLPKYGGKGMYGMHVHKAVKAAREKETGATIHIVNENYDEGQFLSQEKVALTGNETIEEIAEKVQILEHEHYAKQIEAWVNENK